MTKTTQLPIIGPSNATSFVVVDNDITARIRFNDLINAVSLNAQGIQGSQGSSTGMQGTRGIQGIQGWFGTQGTNGRAIQGSQGISGSAVAQGTTGAQGATGIQGAANGPQGTQGIQGRQGTQAAQGVQGPSGTLASAATDTQLLYNDNSTITGDSSLIWDKTSKTLAIGNPSTGGSIMIKGRYSYGATTIFGTEYSSGGPVLGYCVAPNSAATDAFISTYSYSTPISRGAYTISGSNHKWFTTSSQTVAVGSEVKMLQRMYLGETGLTVIGNISATGTVKGAIPDGGIIMWSGSVASIPSGWYLCDGSNGTPNLVDRFIVGAGNLYNPAASGGSKDAIVVSHTHSYTDTGHAHNSQYDSRTPGSIDYNGAGSEIGGMGTTYTYPTTTAVTGITIGTAGSSGTNANLPPYYALAFIMKAASSSVVTPPPGSGGAG